MPKLIGRLPTHYYQRKTLRRYMHNLIDKRNNQTTYKIVENKHENYGYTVTVYSSYQKEVITVKLNQPPEWMTYLIGLMDLAGSNETIQDCMRIGETYWIHPKYTDEK